MHLILFFYKNLLLVLSKSRAKKC